MFDLLGFDRFELIQEILTNRRQIVDSALGGDKTFLPQTDVTKRIPPVQQYQQKPDRPNYGCQVTIQTEEEKRMMKLMRKEERRDRRRQADDADEEQFSLDPETLREQRYCH